MAAEHPKSQQDPTSSDSKAAVELIRAKLADIYNEEPSAKEEIQEVQEASNRSPHQQYMYDLGTSGKDLATIQTEWHNYYMSLSDQDKHRVWQEFYDSQSLATGTPAHTNPTKVMATVKHQAAVSHKPRDTKSRTKLQTAAHKKISANGRLKAKHHIQSLLFGLTTGSVVVFIFLFGFFNEVIITPFIQPARADSSTPLIIGADTVAPTPNPEVIIPKINVEIPVVYSETSTNEAAIENDLLSGVVHYPSTVLPGEIGNAAFFGHSSSNILNSGIYKFAFVLLHRLVIGDTFYLTYNNQVYVYKVISRTVVEPTQVSVLGPVDGHPSTATLITCDPPGTSLHRLIVVGEQIKPDPANNTASSITFTPDTSVPLPGNGPTMWTKVTSTVYGKIAIVAIIAALPLIWFGWRWVNAPLKKSRKV